MRITPSMLKDAHACEAHLRVCDAACDAACAASFARIAATQGGIYDVHS